MPNHAVCQAAARAPCSGGAVERSGISRGWSSGMAPRWRLCTAWPRNIPGTGIAGFASS